MRLPTNLRTMEDQATNTTPGGAEPPRAVATPGSGQSEWPAKVADTIEDVVGAVHDRVVRPLTLVARGVVFGIIIAVVGIVLSILVAIAVVRLLDVYAFGGRVWASDALLGAVLVLAGAFAWSKRRARGAQES
jgi:hypothetical protein